MLKVWREVTNPDLISEGRTMDVVRKVTTVRFWTMSGDHTRSNVVIFPKTVGSRLEVYTRSSMLVICRTIIARAVMTKLEVPILQFVSPYIFPL